MWLETEFHFTMKLQDQNAHTSDEFEVQSNQTRTHWFFYLSEIKHSSDLNPRSAERCHLCVSPSGASVFVHKSLLWLTLMLTAAFLKEWVILSPAHSLFSLSVQSVWGAKRQNGGSEAIKYLPFFQLVRERLKAPILQWVLLDMYISALQCESAVYRHEGVMCCSLIKFSKSVKATIYDTRWV